MKTELDKLFRKGVLMNTVCVGDNCSLLVKEPQNDGINDLSKFTIEGLPKDAVAFSLDINHSRFLEEEFKHKAIKNFTWIINDRLKNVNKNCDIVLIVPTFDSHLVLIGDLKSNSKRARGENIYNKLLNSHLFLKYIFDILESHKLIAKKISSKFGYTVFSNQEGIEVLNGKPDKSHEKNNRVRYIEVKDGGKKHFGYIRDRVVFV